jgi:phenylacetate-coenzyme A ligase PaaK-like adenylate-forming protein
MIANSFPEKQINAVLDYVWNSENSSLYKDYWQNNGIVKQPSVKTYDQFKKIPIADRSVINTSFEPASRCYLPMTDAHTLAQTSGTSGKAPFFLWRYVHPYPHGFLNFPFYYSLGARRTMAFVGSNKIGPLVYSAREAGVASIIGDTHDLASSAKLASLAQIDSLTLPTTLAHLFAKELNNIDYNQNIKLVCLWGEYCSDTSLTLLKKEYPNANFIIEYGLAEAAIHVAEGRVDCENPNRHMHLCSNTSLVEIIDTEVVITTLLLPYGTPLIRYKTGDSARFVDGLCPCGNPTPRIEILGRMNGDFIRIGGGEVRVEELDRVMQPLLMYVEPTYSLIVDEVVNGDVRSGVLTLKLTKRDGISLPEESLELLVTKEVTENMRISQNLNLTQSLKRGLIKSFSISFVDKPEVGIKHKKLIQKFV